MALPFTKAWRFVVCDLDGTVLTLLDSLAEQRNVTYTLNAPAQATGRVPSDNPQVNLIVGTGSLAGDPLVSYSDRVLFGFRRDGDAASSMSPGPWTCRFAGILMQLEDDATSDDAFSTYTAYDPWQYMLSRPCRDGDGNLPGVDGLVFDGGSTTLDQIAVNLIDETDTIDGATFIDTAGHIETIPFTGTFVIQQGTSVGDALTQLCNTGLMDIWLEPVYDPFIFPLTFLTQLNIYAQQGSTRNDAVMSWDSPGKSLVAISRLLDGAQMANSIQFYNGQGGPPVTLQTSPSSMLKYGAYWAQQFFPGQTAPQAVVDIAAEQVLLRQIGKRTLTVNPAPERAPDPFTSYFLGDLVPTYATKRLRQTLPAPQETENYVRIYGIPIDISDNSVETVSQLLISPDGFSP